MGVRNGRAGRNGGRRLGRTYKTERAVSVTRGKLPSLDLRRGDRGGEGRRSEACAMLGRDHGKQIQLVE